MQHIRASGTRGCTNPGKSRYPIPRAKKNQTSRLHHPAASNRRVEKAGIETFGGRELLDKFINQELTPDMFTHAFATQEMAPHLKSVARILGRAGLQPTAKGDYNRRRKHHPRRHEIVPDQTKGKPHLLPVGNCTFSDSQIMSNLKAISDEIHSKIDANTTKRPVWATATLELPTVQVSS